MLKHWILAAAIYRVVLVVILEWPFLSWLIPSFGPLLIIRGPDDSLCDSTHVDQPIKRWACKIRYLAVKDYLAYDPAFEQMPPFHRIFLALLCFATTFFVCFVARFAFMKTPPTYAREFCLTTYLIWYISYFAMVIEACFNPKANPVMIALFNSLEFVFATAVLIYHRSLLINDMNQQKESKSKKSN